LLMLMTRDAKLGESSSKTLAKKSLILPNTPTIAGTSVAPEMAIIKLKYQVGLQVMKINGKTSIKPMLSCTFSEIQGNTKTFITCTKAKAALHIDVTGEKANSKE